MSLNLPRAKTMSKKKNYIDAKRTLNDAERMLNGRKFLGLPAQSAKEISTSSDTRQVSKMCFLGGFRGFLGGFSDAPGPEGPERLL